MNQNLKKCRACPNGGDHSGRKGGCGCPCHSKNVGTTVTEPVYDGSLKLEAENVGEKCCRDYKECKGHGELKFSHCEECNAEKVTTGELIPEKEPWVSVLGALEDVRAGKATTASALEWIYQYVSPEIAAAKREERERHAAFIENESRAAEKRGAGEMKERIEAALDEMKKEPPKFGHRHATLATLQEIRSLLQDL